MKFYASGKLLLFGEYLVLRGTECLAIPLKYGQTMKVTERIEPEISWNAKANEAIWFSVLFSKELEIIKTSNTTKANRLRELLIFLKSQNTEIFQSGMHIETQTNFPPEWGFGTSSTMVSLLSQWSGVDPYQILDKSFGGSGYDVACATADTPILYKAETQKTRTVDLAKAVTSKILFVYSGKKQETYPEIKRFNTFEIASETLEKMDRIISTAVKSKEIQTFEKAMGESEDMLSEILNLPAIKQDKFADYPFVIKSLGAWGGDFFMATYRNEAKARRYFKDLGYTVQFNYDELIKV